MEFLKSSDLKLNAAGYLVSKDDKPVYNQAFVNAQISAHLFVSIAKACEGKIFKTEKAASFVEIVNKVRAEISTNTVYQYEKAPVKKESILDKITAAGLEFVEFEGATQKAAKINSLMAEYEPIRKTEQFGEFFQEGVQELKNLYTVKDVLAAAKIIVEIE